MKIKTTEEPSQIVLFGAVMLDAAEGPFGLKVYPPEALESTLKAYHKRLMIHRWNDKESRLTTGRKRKEKKERVT